MTITVCGGCPASAVALTVAAGAEDRSADGAAEHAASAAAATGDRELVMQRVMRIAIVQL